MLGRHRSRLWRCRSAEWLAERRAIGRQLWSSSPNTGMIMQETRRMLTSPCALMIYNSRVTHSYLLVTQYLRDSDVRSWNRLT